MIETSSRTSRRRAVVGVLCAMQFVDVMGVTLVVTALPRMLEDLDATAPQGGAVVATYAVCFGGLLIAAGRLGDRWDHRRTLIAGSLLFAAASALGWMASTIEVVVVARGLQGVAAAVSVPAALRMLTDVSEEGAQRRRALAGWSAAGAVAGVSGFVIGGALTELSSWRGVFAVGTIAGLVLVAALVVLAPAGAGPAAGVRVPVPAAVALTATAAGTVAGPTLAGEHGATSLGALALLGALLAGAIYLYLERTSAHRLVPASVLRRPAVRWGSAVSFVNTATTSSAATLAMLQLQEALGFTPMGAAGILVAFSVLVVVTSSLAPALVARAGWARTMATGIGLIALGNATMGSLPSAAGIAVGSSLCGAGIGVASVASTDLGTTTVPAERSTAAALLNTAAQLGTAVGTATLLAIASAVGPASAWWVVAFASAAAGVLVALRAPSHQADLVRTADAPKIVRTGPK